MKQSDMNHLRRLLGWIRCDIGQAPAELQQTMIDVAAGLSHPEISEEAKARMVETYRRAEAVPLYVRAAVKALEKTLPVAGRDRGAGSALATAATRVNAGFNPGAAAGREPALDDVDVERGLAEIGVHAWGPRAEDWLAGAAYAARLLRGYPHSLAAKRVAGDASAAAEALPAPPDAAGDPVPCRGTPAAPPSLRRDDTGGVDAARREDAPDLISTVINDACWVFVEAMPHQLPGPIFNDLKPALHAAVCHVLERQSPAVDTAAMRRAMTALIAECTRADAQAAREVQRTFIHPNILEGARRALAAGNREGQAC